MLEKPIVGFYFPLGIHLPFKNSSSTGDLFYHQMVIFPDEIFLVGQASETSLTKNSKKK